jgi:uncharacterized protein
VESTEPNAPTGEPGMFLTELAELADWLDAHSSLDLPGGAVARPIDGLLGFLHAVALAPDLLRPREWLSALLRADVNPSGDELSTFERRVGALQRGVVAALERGETMVPEADDPIGADSFAAGYVRGAELQQEWLGTQVWATTLPIAFLADRLDLLPGTMAKDIEEGLQPDAKQAIRAELADLVMAAYGASADIRRASVPDAPVVKPPRVGRNDPCPCGSGKKHKRCCG